LQKSSFSPTTAPEKVLMSQRTSWETPRGRYDEHSNKFSLSIKPKFNRPVGERNHFQRLLLADFGNGARKQSGAWLAAPAAMWNLHTTQPNYFSPTYSEVVNLTGLLKIKG
jgi:hypothetical protein